MDSIKIFGVRIHNTTLAEVTSLLREYLKGDKLSVIYTPNTEIVMAAKDDEDLKKLLNKADLIIPDGIGLIYGSRIKKKPLKERVTGFDTSMKLLDIANENSYSIFLLGGKDGVAKIAAENIEIDYPNIKIAGYQHGYFKGSHLDLVDHEEEKEIVSRINNANPDIIFVGLGFPMQEKWIDRNKDRLTSRVIIGNGGVIDILAGNAKRAPEIYQNLGLEWLYRLIKNPSRIKRQMAIPKFMLHVLFGKNVIQ
jgi:N-acetylglucosaminyldiphosphoundecaprenol N-acetyl-beta-D-mannosaminyltransferase